MGGVPVYSIMSLSPMVHSFVSPKTCTAVAAEAAELVLHQQQAVRGSSVAAGGSW